MHNITSNYFEPSRPGSFHAVSGFAKNTKISFYQAKRKLADTGTVSLHALVRRHGPRRRVICQGINNQWHADLIDLRKHKRQNDNFQYILTVIDCFSKVGEAKAIKNKCTITVAKAFEGILKQRRTSPQNLQVDMGSEFYGQSFQNVCKKYSINMFSVYSEIKIFDLRAIQSYIDGTSVKILDVFKVKKIC